MKATWNKIRILILAAVEMIVRDFIEDRAARILVKRGYEIIPIQEIEGYKEMTRNLYQIVNSAPIVGNHNQRRVAMTHLKILSQNLTKKIPTRADLLARKTHIQQVKEF